jgi:hypothetical protein
MAQAQMIGFLQARDFFRKSTARIARAPTAACRTFLSIARVGSGSRRQNAMLG